MSKKLLAMIGGVVAALALFGAIFAHIASDSFDDERKLKLACHWLDDGRWDLAAEMAEDLRSQLNIDEDSRWQYVAGVALIIKLHDDLDSSENRKKVQEAVYHLIKSRELGFPVGLTGKGHYYLGLSLFHTYQWDDAIESLKKSYSDFPEYRSQSLHMIVTALLRKPNPDLQAAEETLAIWEAIPGKSASESAKTYLARGQLAHLRTDLRGSLEWLSKVPPTLQEHSEASIWRARTILQLAREEQNENKRQEMLKETAQLLKGMVFSASSPTIARKQANFLQGKTLRELGQLEESANVLSIVRQQYPYSAEAIAASLEEAEILLQLGKYHELLITTRQLLRTMGDIELYNDFWMPLDDLRTRLVSIGEALRNQTEFEKAIELAEQIALAFPPAYSLRLQAHTLEAWADSLLQQLDTLESRLPAQIGDLYSQAGKTFERLAEIELQTDEYMMDIWKAAEAYQKANKIDSANRLLENYLQYEMRAKQPRGLLALGKNLVTVGRWQESLVPLERCLDYFPSSPSCFEARLLLAQSNAELDNLDRAIELLSSNLWDFDLSPESPVWRDSSFELGNLLHRRGANALNDLRTNPPRNWSDHLARLQTSQADLLHSIDQLSEATDRYPHDPRYFQSRYLLASSYRLAAEMPKTIASKDANLPDASRRHQNQVWRKYLDQAVEQFHGLLSSIHSAKDPGSLAPAILKNCYFGEGDSLVQLGKYEAAIQSYKAAASYYVNQPEALEALVQVAECQRLLGLTKEARHSLRQAEQVLQRIPPDLDARFVSTTRGDRKHWSDLLGWLSKEYQ